MIAAARLIKQRPEIIGGMAFRMVETDIIQCLL
jgi:hypothetical protein